MSKRITERVSRAPLVSILINGAPIEAHEGESLATALIAAGALVLSRDSSGRLRSPYCNMGVCFDCLVEVEERTSSGTASRRLRACMTEVRAGLRINIPHI
jgi:D-hydroxyproline dehydrogenase subunit gamma